MTANSATRNCTMTTAHGMTAYARLQADWHAFAHASIGCPIRSILEQRYKWKKAKRVRSGVMTSVLGETDRNCGLVQSADLLAVASGCFARRRLGDRVVVRDGIFVGDGALFRYGNVVGDRFRRNLMLFECRHRLLRLMW